MYLIFACTLLHSEPMSASVRDLFFYNDAFTSAIIGCLYATTENNILNPFLTYGQWIQTCIDIISLIEAPLEYTSYILLEVAKQLIHVEYLSYLHVRSLFMFPSLFSSHIAHLHFRCRAQ